MLFFLRWLSISVLTLGSISYATCSLIKIDLINGYFSHNIAIYLGTKTNVEYFRLDLTSEQSWIISLNNFQSTSSQILEENVTINFEEEQYQGNRISDRVLLDDGHSLQLEFFVVEKARLYFELPKLRNKIGMAYSFKDTNSSLLHQYKNQGLIGHLSFSLTDNYKLFLGGIPVMYLRDRHYSYCNVIGKNSSWNCALSKVIITNGTKTIERIEKSLITFITDKRYNYMPKVVFDMMISQIYSIDSNSIPDQQFIVQRTMDKVAYVYTASEWNTKRGNITFVIDGYSYTIDLVKFWECNVEGCYLKLYENPYGDHWVIGSNFYDKIHIHFDSENAKMHFYAQNGVCAYYNNTNDDDSYPKTAFKSIALSKLIIEIIGIALLLVNKHIVNSIHNISSKYCYTNTYYHY